MSVSASAPLILDAIYAPWPTVLAETAQQAGCVVSGGRELLIGQALLQLELMTGRTVSAETLYAALAD
jgi:shikimate dehydrogenase